MLSENMMMNTIITTLPTEVIYFPYYEFINNLSDEEIGQVRKNVNHLASNEQILQTYLENLCWNDFKKMISQQTILKSSINKKLKGENARVFRMDFGENKLVSKSKLRGDLELLGILTGIKSEIMGRKKKNLRERMKFRQKKKEMREKNELKKIQNDLRKKRMIEKDDVERRKLENMEVKLRKWRTVMNDEKDLKEKKRLKRKMRLELPMIKSLKNFVKLNKDALSVRKSKGFGQSGRLFKSYRG